MAAFSSDLSDHYDYDSYGDDDDYWEGTSTRARVQLSKEATQRLLRDWKEVEKEPIHTVTAKPLENNLSEWHCTLTPDDGPYHGTSFHLILMFPANYPHSPPDVRISTRLRHPNVFSGSICLDMIKAAAVYAQPHRGWSTAYSVQSILLQLQSFLFAEYVDQDWGRSRVYSAPASIVANAKRDAAAFLCQACGFKGLPPTVADATVENWDAAADDGEATLLPPGVDHVDYNVSGCAPTNVAIRHNEAFRRFTSGFECLETTVEDAIDGDNDEATLLPPGVEYMDLDTFGRSGPPDRLSALPADVLVQIMDRLDAAALSALVRASKHFVRASTEYGVWVRRELQCFHSKRSLTEEVLGFGIATKGADATAPYSGFAYCTCFHTGRCDLCREDQQNPRAQKRTGKWEGVLRMDYISAGRSLKEMCEKASGMKALRARTSAP